VVKQEQRMKKIQLDKYTQVAHKYPTDDIRKKKRQEIENKGRWSLALLVMCVGFSILGAEIFWQKAFQNQSPLFHILGVPLGFTVSALLLFFEFKEDAVQLAIESVIASNALIQLAMNESAKARIFRAMFDEQSTLMDDSGGFRGTIRAAARNHMIGAAQDAIGMTGISVTREQLLREVQDEQDGMIAADAALASPTTITEALPVQQRTGLIGGGRHTEQRKKVERMVRSYGEPRIRGDLKKFADEGQMSEKTLKRWLDTISSERVTIA
jgi:hypothetical protein